ncbi:3 beta-hydroxysteroid dehydrogenase/Delta 5--_4-isomerase type 3 isoform X2 [Episyrphus balteatus]|uniref:3 beta-hydroxysteroid dehydrogenase/Delta 5-->4-isomerase type 3 isoform X2 n=1 Tax=Episyrphus balteatus TaxID=286459 RepID=UPI002486BE2E|nr:3 beta-hydroxysteroid dehydrogenase/Delta 5-->4-isomerase type 3 isoform X2 [Episyrphus balteatus]
MTENETVLVIGGSGFIGQHIIKLLLQSKDELKIKEIRSLDKEPYKNTIGNFDTSQLVTFVGDICEPETMETAFSGVETVFHCAAYVNIQYPPNYQELERVNVNGTRSVIDMCIKHNVIRLVYTSCASVCLIPFKGYSTFSIIINQTESKALTPVHDLNKSPIEFDKGFLIPGYSASKLRAEKIVLNSSGATLSNQAGCLQTVAMRPPLTYGEGDNHFMPAVFRFLSKRGNIYPRIAGSGGKQQLAYAGNIAWGHICAYKTLKASPKAIASLPVFITDDTPINDMARFVQKVGRATGAVKFKTSVWSIPHFIFYLLAFLVEKVASAFNFKLDYSLRAVASFTASVLLFSRLRADIHIDYEPLIDGDKSLEISGKWYSQWYQKNIHNSQLNKKK